MIVWLASYPRSGNTFLRTILKKVFEVESYSDEKKPEEVWKLDVEKNVIGHKEFDVSWHDFYQMARDSEEKFFIKTHLAPMDDSPAIYVVRDGRNALLSYYYFMQKYFPEARRSLFQLIAGYDYYGRWSAHYEAWRARGGVSLVLRYEDMLASPEEQIEKIADFIALPRQNSWVNPFDELSKKDPSFFRVGKSEWSPNALWSREHERLFWESEGGVMESLGYRMLREDEFVDRDDQGFFREALDAFRVFGDELDFYKKTAAERLDLIEYLHAENQKRLDIINSLSIN